MCTGVITMIKVITNWPTTIEATANCTNGRPKIVRIGRAALDKPDSACRWVSRLWLSSFGSGRRRANMSSAASRVSMVPTQYGPA